MTPENPEFVYSMICGGVSRRDAKYHGPEILEALLGEYAEENCLASMSV